MMTSGISATKGTKGTEGTQIYVLFVPFVADPLLVYSAAVLTSLMRAALPRSSRM